MGFIDADQLRKVANPLKKKWLWNLFIKTT